MKAIADNKRARRNWSIEDTFEAGIVLLGSEIKAIRQGKVNLSDGYAAYQHGEIFLHSVHIAPHDNSRDNHDPLRTRKLLLKSIEIKKIKTKIDERGFSLIPLKMYFNSRNIAKLEVALAKGKKKYDKRDVIDREQNRKSLREVKKSHR